MSGSGNPDLLKPGQTPRESVSVPPTGSGLTPAMSTTVTKTDKYYATTVPAAKMIRQDGKSIAFPIGICKTNILEDQNYLEQEIAAGNPYISHATDEQSKNYEMRLNPKEFIKKQVEDDVRADERMRVLDELNLPDSHPIRVQATAMTAHRASPDTYDQRHAIFGKEPVAADDWTGNGMTANDMEVMANPDHTPDPGTGSKVHTVDSTIAAAKAMIEAKAKQAEAQHGGAGTGIAGSDKVTAKAKSNG